MSILSAFVRASAVLDFNADPAATDTVTIGNQTYAYTATPQVANDVDVGTTRDESIENLVAAINGAAGAGSAYDEDTVENPFVTAVADLTADEVTITAKLPGTLGNGITVDTSETDILFKDTAVTLEGGVGDLSAGLERFLDEYQLQSDAIAFVRALTDRVD